MKRIFSIAAFLLSIPLIFVVILMVILSNPESYRDEISASVKASTGYELQINGDINWRYWPPIALEIEDVSLGIPGDSTPFLTLENAAIDLDLLPIFTGGNTIGVSGLTVHGLTVRALIDEQGRGNWEIDEADTSQNVDPKTIPSTPTGDTTADTDSAADSSPSNFQLHIADIDITDATIEYRDESSDDHYLLKIISLTMGPVDYDSPIELQVNFELEDPSQQISAVGSIDGTLTTNSEFDQLTFEDLTIISTAQVPEAGTIGSAVTLTGELNLRQDRLRIEEGSLQIGELQTSFSMTVDNMSSDELQFNAKLEVPRFNPRSVADQFQVALPETANINSLTQLSFNGTLTGNSNQIKIEDISGMLDSSQFSGSVVLVTGKKDGITFDLALDEINVSHYLEPDEIDQTKQKVPGNKQNTSGGHPGPPVSIQDSELIPVKLLAEYDLSGTFTIATLHYDTYQFSNFKLDLQNEKGKLHSSIVLNGYDGNINLDIKTKWRKKVSTVFKVDTEGINLPKLLQSESVTGNLNLDSELVFRGTMMSEAMATLDGTSRFRIKNGTLDVTTLKQLVATIDVLRGKQSSIGEWPDKMPFKVLKGNHTFNQGTLANQKLKFTLENLVVRGTGGFDYFKDQIIYDLTATITGTTDGGFEVSSSLVDVAWPLHCEGSLEAPASDLCRPDKKAIQSLVADIAKQELKLKAQSELDKIIEDKVPKEIKDLLKGLFRR